MSEKGFRIEIPVHIKRDRRARKVLAPDETGSDAAPVPRIALLLALAHKWEGMVRRGEVKGYAELAGRFNLTRGRISQICGLMLLAPTLQEAIFSSDGDPLTKHLREFQKRIAWDEQVAEVKTLTTASV